MSALDPQKVPISCMTLRFAIVAHNVYHSLQIGGHGMLRNVSRPGLPGRRHGLLRDDRLFANGTTVIETSKFAKAVGVNRMPTGQILGRLSRRKHVFAAYRTIVLVLVLETPVGFKDIDRNTHTTFRAMSEIFLASNSAKATLVAMKGFFGLTHPQIALGAVIFPEYDLAIDTLIRGHLPCPTKFTDHLSDHESIHWRVPGWTRLVVTDPASDNSSTTRGNNVAIPLVVRAFDVLLLGQDRSRSRGNLRPTPAH